MKAYTLTPTPEYKARNRKILKWHAAGWSYGRISRELGITRQRVAQIVKAG